MEENPFWFSWKWFEGTGIGHVLPYCQLDIWSSDDYAVILNT